MSDVFSVSLVLVLGPIFSQKIISQQQTANELLTFYTYGIAVLIVTASVRLRYLLYADRRATLADSGSDNIDFLAANGLFTPSLGGPLRCFHCDAVVYTSAAAASGADADIICAAHRAASPACYLARIACLHLLDSAGTLAMQSDARRFQTVLRRLRQVLDAPVFYAASAYGFETNYLRLCAGRHFMRNDCAIVDKPGDLLQLAQEFEELQPPDSPIRNIDLLRILEIVGTAPSAGPAGTTSELPPPPSAQQQPPQLSGLLVAADNRGLPMASADTSSSLAAALAEADDRCIRCHSRSRNRVTLPCAHFLLCDRCLESLSHCPKCSKTIVATVTAFIT